MKDKNMHSNLRIHEVFYSFQGEGKTIGEPRLFIRLSGCNLNCKFCDSQYHKEVKLDNRAILDKVIYNFNSKEVVKYVPIFNKWCITGGEPLLQQEEIVKAIQIYQPKWVEIETNGTIQPSNSFLKHVNLINISPKDNKHQKQPRNVNLAVNFKKLPAYIIKFVYSNKQSEEFIEKTIKKHKIPNDKVYVMPEGKTKAQQEEKMKQVVRFCLKHGYNFSPRAHILIYNSKKGV